MNENTLEKEKKEILTKYRRLLRKSKPFLKDNDHKIIRRAFNAAMNAHEGARRRSGEPYIYHPLEVAEICTAEFGLGTTSIVAALLHDVVEDSEYTIEDIEKMFGKKVSVIIEGLTKISDIFEYGISQQAENFRKLIYTLAEDTRVILIKLADRLHNMRTLDGMPRDKQLKIANETIYMYSPLAHRLGLYACKTELEDLYLKYSEPKIYKDITEKIDKSKQVRDKLIRHFIRPVKARLDQSNIPYEIKGRLKSVYSIWKKIKKQGISFEEVYDLFAIRIILDTSFEKEKEICWHIYGIVSSLYKPHRNRNRDWINTPKTNGYESLHTTVMDDKGHWVEVQIRTKRMDEIAEKGYAAHWKYKNEKDIRSDHTTGLEIWLNKAREALKQKDLSALEFVNNFKSSLYTEEIFVFTPIGELITLPQGASVLDFAFEIHTEIGKQCLGAKINKKLASLDHILKSGDQIEVLTSSKQKVSENWLKYVITHHAKIRIRDLLKEERKHVINEGSELVKRQLKKLNLAAKPNILEQIAHHFNATSVSEVFYKIGSRQIDSEEIASFKKIKKENEKKEKSIKFLKNHKEKTNNGQILDNELILLDGEIKGSEYKLSPCCNPVLGDDIFGFYTIKEGVKIHRTTCENAAELLANFGHKVIKAEWASLKNHSFEVILLIIGTDRLGLVSELSNVISEQLKVNMKSLEISTQSGLFRGIICLDVQDKEHIKTLIKKIKKINGLINVIRKF